MKYMKRNEVINCMADKAHIPWNMAYIAYDSILFIIRYDLYSINHNNFLKNNDDFLKKNDKFPKNQGVRIPKLGTFMLHTYTARKGYNPVTEQTFEIPKHNYIRFKPSPVLSKRILKIYTSKSHSLEILLNELNQMIAWRKKLIAKLKHK